MVLYLAAAAATVCLSREQINPDGISYARLARHFAEGRLDLAVASYWSPLLPWLLTPAAYLGWDPVLASKVLGIGFGLGFGFAAVSLARNLGAGRHSGLALAPALAAALVMLPEPVTPDILLAWLITAYLARGARLLRGGTAWCAFSAGLLGGLAFLAKAYALPFVAAHLMLTFAFRHFAGRRGTGGPDDRRTGRPGDSSLHGPTVSRSHGLTALGPLAAAFAGVLLIAGPWVAAISVHDGVLTLGSVDRLAEPFIVAGEGNWRDQPCNRLQTPRPGRLTCWEDPLEISEEFVGKYRLTGDRRSEHRWNAVRQNVVPALRTVWQADCLGLLAGAWVTTVLLLAFRRRFADGRTAERLWSASSAALYVGGYVFLLVEARYFWPVQGLLVAMGVCAAVAVCGRRERWGWFVPLIVSLGLVGSLAGVAGLNAWHWRAAGDRRLEAEFPCLANRMGFAGPVVSNHWHYGLYAAYRQSRNEGAAARTVYFGEFRATDAESVAGELRPFGAATVLVFDDDALAGRLREDARFTEISDARQEATGRTVHVLRFRPIGGR